MVTIERSYGDRVGGEVPITNEGTVPTGNFTVGLDWLDEDGEYLATSNVYGILLGPGETWSARTDASVEIEDPDAVDGVEAVLTNEQPASQVVPDPEGITLDNESVRASDQQVLVRGAITNDRDESEFVYAAAKVYDAEETVLGNEWTIEEVAAGGTWRFEIEPGTGGRNGQVTSGTVIPYLETL